MQKIKRTFQRILSLISISVILFSLVPQESFIAEAQTATKLTGYSWSSNVGWMSLNGPAYGVTTTPRGDFTSGAAHGYDLRGYAWSSTIGWISFEPAAVTDCDLSKQTGTLYSCNPYIDLSTDIDPGVKQVYRVEGFARACAVFVSGCSGPTKLTTTAGSQELGGWDGYNSLTSGDGSPWGWKLVESTVGPIGSKKIVGYAWGDSVIGWLDIDAECPGCREAVIEGSIKSACVDKSPYVPQFDLKTGLVNATSCTLERTVPTGGSSVTLPVEDIVRYSPTGIGFQVPAVDSATYKYSCGGTEVGSVNVSRCTTLCPNGTPVPPSGICSATPPLCPNGTPVPPSGICPVTPALCPNGTPLPADKICPGDPCPKNVPRNAVGKCPQSKPIIKEI